MIRLIFRILFELNKWRVMDEIGVKKNIKKCVMIAAPHTSNWDLVYAVAALNKLGIKTRFTIKKEWMRFPLNIAMGPMGGIGIDRKPKKDSGLTRKRNMVEVMAELYETRDELSILVTPEGSRGKQTKWRTGFYHVALKAKVPILLGYVDYKNKIAGIGGVIEPSGNIKEDMLKIMDFYSKIEPKFPENFSLDTNYPR